MHEIVQVYIYMWLLAVGNQLFVCTQFWKKYMSLTSKKKKKFDLINIYTNKSIITDTLKALHYRLSFFSENSSYTELSLRSVLGLERMFFC